MIDVDADLAVTSRGALAAQLRELLATLVDKHVHSLLTRAMSEWRDRTLTGDNARATIVAIAALRDLLASVEADVRRGLDARERLTQSPGPIGTAR